jgi:protein disulfide-isomerase-like protein
MKLSLSILALTAAMTSAAVPSLTPENYDSMTDGKTVFIKFFAPWCGHCKKMAPDWEKLAGEWEGHDIGLVAEVDCTAAGKELCNSNGVQGFPTLKYGDPSALEDYQGGRSYDDLSKFAKENLKPICSPSKLDLCDDDKKKEIETLMATSDDDLKAKIAAEEKKLEDAEEEFKAEVQKLQEKYQSLMKEKDDKAAAVKAAGLGLMKSVVAFKAKMADKEL